MFSTSCPGQNVVKIVIRALSGPAGRIYHRIYFFAVMSSLWKFEEVKSMGYVIKK